MIYNIKGESLGLVHDVHGAILYSAYNIAGETIFFYKYGNPTMTYTSIGGYDQGIDIYGDVLAIWNDNSYTINLRDISTGTLIASLQTDITNHGNDISFTNEFYAEGDEFPLLLVGNSYLFRITRESATLVRTYKMPKHTFNEYTYGMGYGIGFDGSIMYDSGYRTGRYGYSDDNRIRIAKYDTSELTDNGDGTYTPKLLGYVDRAWLACIQGATYHDGLFWCACGMTSPGYIYGINPDTGAIQVSINLGETGELEGLGWGYNDTDGWYLMGASVAKRKFYKVTFD